MSRAEARPRRPRGLIGRLLAFIFSPTLLVRRSGRTRRRVSTADQLRPGAPER